MLGPLLVPLRHFAVDDPRGDSIAAAVILLGPHLFQQRFVPLCQGVRRAAVTCGLSEIGELKILTEQGKQEILLAGDVSVRRSFEAGKGQ